MSIQRQESQGTRRTTLIFPAAVKAHIYNIQFLDLYLEMSEWRAKKKKAIKFVHERILYITKRKMYPEKSINKLIP